MAFRWSSLCLTDHFMRKNVFISDQVRPMHELEGTATLRRGESNTSINSFIYSPNQFIMKKKVFSLMMTLLLAFVGVAKAEVVTIGDGTGTTYYAPFNSLWGYSFVEQVYTASEIGTAGTINAISFNMSSTDAQTNQVDVFMKNVSRTNFSDNTDWEPVTASDMVFSGTVTFNNGWTTITLDTPFQYDGTSNLMIGMQVHLGLQHALLLLHLSHRWFDLGSQRHGQPRSVQHGFLQRNYVRAELPCQHPDRHHGWWRRRDGRSDDW